MAAVQSAKAALAAAVENTEGVREAVAAKEVLEAAQKSSTAAWRAHSVSATLLSCLLRSNQYTVAWHVPYVRSIVPPLLLVIDRPAGVDSNRSCLKVISDRAGLL